MVVLDKKIIILGAGLAGIELGKLLKQSGNNNFIILEKESQIGGLCRSNVTNNYYWDFGVHAIYSRKKEAINYFQSLPIDYNQITRNVKIFHTDYNNKTRILDYPFETGISDLPLQERVECILGYCISKLKNKPYSNLKEWIERSLGRGIAKHFMLPYNRKIWNCKLSQISMDLVNQKIEPYPIYAFLLNSFGINYIGRREQNKFIYPSKGINELINCIAKDIKDNIYTKSEAISLMRQNNKWNIFINNDLCYRADTVISTMPLVELLKKVNLDNLKSEYQEFQWNNTYFIMVGLKEGFDFNVLKNCQWGFFKENEIFYRITLMHNFNSSFPPTLVAEITLKDKIFNKSTEEIENSVINDLILRGIISSINHIATTDIKLINYTYPIPTIGIEPLKEKIKNELENNNMFLLGRNGNWDYINMDMVILNAKELFNKKFSHAI